MKLRYKQIACRKEVSKMNLEDHISKIQKNTDNSNDISKRELEFATFCVEILRERNNITSKEA